MGKIMNILSRYLDFCELPIGTSRCLHEEYKLCSDFMKVKIC